MLAWFQTLTAGIFSPYHAITRFLPPEFVRVSNQFNPLRPPVIVGKQGRGTRLPSQCQAPAQLVSIWAAEQCSYLARNQVAAHLIPLPARIPAFVS